LRRRSSGVLRVLAESGIDSGVSFTVEEARAHWAGVRSTSSFRLRVAIVDGEIAGTYSLVFLDKLGKRGRRAPALWKMWVCPAKWDRPPGLSSDETNIAGEGE
jgi:hypothetical protein